MGKSSSRKRKRSDASRLSRKKKSKSKRTRNKSKKLHHHHRSDSYSSDSDSAASTYSSSQDDYRRQRRSRSLSRGNARGSKKRNRRRSYSSESSEDSRPARKRRGSKRNDDRKKIHRKKHKRRVSASSTSSGSLSCSTCDSRSKCCEESEFESRRSRSRQRDGHNRGAAKDKIVAERSRYKARSHSSCSKCSMDSHDQNDEILVNADSSKRLRSVIMVSNEAEERKLDRDEHKEEILYDNDDYPSSRSTDNNGSGSKRELARQSYVESKLKGHCEDFAEDAAPNKRSTSVVEKSGGCNDQFDGSNPSSDVVPSFTAVNGNNDTVSDGAVGDDLESVLRQKALENLKKFRGINKGNQDSGQHGNIDDVKQTPTVTTESTKFPKEASTHSAHTAQNKGTTITQRRISIHKTSFDGNIGDQEHEAVKPSSSRGSIQLPDCGLLGGNLRRLGDFTANNPRLTPFTWRRDMTKTEAAAGELPRLPKEPPQAKLLETEVAANKNVASMAKIGTRERSSRDGGVKKESGSAVSEPSSSLYPKSVSGEKNPTDKVEDEAKDGPQYEQRTMSVTRGGETIQVNYQVYIPKRAPALSRRQLKR